MGFTELIEWILIEMSCNIDLDHRDNFCGEITEPSRFSRYVGQHKSMDKAISQLAEELENEKIIKELALLAKTTKDDDDQDEALDEAFDFFLDYTGFHEVTNLHADDNYDMKMEFLSHVTHPANS